MKFAQNSFRINWIDTQIVYMICRTIYGCIGREIKTFKMN